MAKRQLVSVKLLPHLVTQADTLAGLGVLGNSRSQIIESALRDYVRRHAQELATAAGGIPPPHQVALGGKDVGPPHTPHP